MRGSDATPKVVISVPCPRCGDAPEPDPHCPTCTGQGILLERVDPQEAARSRTQAKPPRPAFGGSGPRRDPQGPER